MLHWLWKRFKKKEKIGSVSDFKKQMWKMWFEKITFHVSCAVHSVMKPRVTWGGGCSQHSRSETNKPPASWGSSHESPASWRSQHHVDASDSKASQPETKKKKNHPNSVSPDRHPGNDPSPKQIPGQWRNWTTWLFTQVLLLTRVRNPSLTAGERTQLITTCHIGAVTCLYLGHEGGSFLTAEADWH